MFCEVYRTRFHDARLPVDEARATMVAGELRLHRRGMRRCAVVLANDGETYLVPVMDHVRIVEINDRGMLLAGIECYPGRSVKGSGPTYQQGWWCRPTAAPLGDARRRERALELRRQAIEMGRTMSAGGG